MNNFLISSISNDTEMTMRPHSSSLVIRKGRYPSTLGSVSAPHTPTSTHLPPLPILHETQTKLGFGARLKAASFSYKTRPRDRSPKISESDKGKENIVTANGINTNSNTQSSFRFRSVTTGSFFRSRNKDKKEIEQAMEGIESAATKM